MKKLILATLGVAVATLLAGGAWAAELRVGLALEPSSIDPHYHNLSPNNSFGRHIFDRLVQTDEKQRLGPGLAVSWQPLDDTTWASPSSFALYTKGKTLRKIDDHTIHVATERPHPLMPNDLSTINIISRKHGQGAKTGDYNSGKAAIGTGPYKFVEWTPGDKLIIERNPDYWGEKAKFDRVVMKPIKSGPARVAALLAGDVDFIDLVPTADIARLQGESGVVLSSGVSNRVIYLHLDHDRDVRHRHGRQEPAQGPPRPQGDLQGHQSAGHRREGDGGCRHPSRPAPARRLLRREPGSEARALRPGRRKGLARRSGLGQRLWPDHPRPERPLHQ
jgi:peptide/nickel transport system substrate-binding protein